MRCGGEAAGKIDLAAVASWPPNLVLRHVFVGDGGARKQERELELQLEVCS